MISRQEIRELAQFQADSQAACALSFYFQPLRPQNKSHREETILAKDMVRQALQEAEKQGKNGPTRSDLQRILQLAEGLHGNQTLAKAVFACGAKNFWREYNLPPQLSGTQLVVNRRFCLKPLSILLAAQPKLAVVIFDRQRARFFSLRLDELVEGEDMFHSLSRRGRSDGYAGYDAGHSERRVNEEAQHHFKAVAERLKEEADKGLWEKLVVGCLDSTWYGFEPQLHPYVRQRLTGRFTAEIDLTPEQVCAQAQKVWADSQASHYRELVRAVLSEAKSHKRGATGLRRVLRSLEMGEVQTLVMDQNFSSRAVECTFCGHIDAHLVSFCPLCGHATRELDDVCEAIIPRAIQADMELVYVKNDPNLDGVGNIAALLRFRAEKGSGGQVAQAS
jgi:peptide subunit release factor 1 (eRF1)